MITTYRAKAQNMDLSYSWQLNENFIFSDQINNVITENIANLPNIAGILISKDGKKFQLKYQKCENCPKSAPRSVNYFL